MGGPLDFRCHEAILLSPRWRAVGLGRPDHLPSWGADPGRVAVAGADGGARGARRLRHRGAPGSPTRPPQAPGRGLPLHLLPLQARPAAALAPGGRRRRSTGRGRRPRTPTGAGTRRAVDGRLRQRRCERVLASAGRHRSRYRARPARPHGARGRALSAASGCTSGRWSTAARRSTGTPAAAAARCRPATDAVVEGHQVALHALRRLPLLHPGRRAAQPRPPTRETQPALEQPGCLHAGMDLYKWAHKLGPLVPERPRPRRFELARDIRSLDMRAAPYDLRDSATTRCASRHPRARRSMPPSSAASQRAVRRCGPGSSKPATASCSACRADRAPPSNAPPREAHLHRTCLLCT